MLANIVKIRFLLLRRMLQLTLLGLFMASQYLGWNILKGNYSSALLFDTIYLTDPFAGLQILLSGIWLGTKAMVGATIILFLYGSFFGRAFCSWVCPINLVNDTAVHIGKKIAPGRKITAIVPVKTRYIVLVLALVLSLLLQIPSFETISPIGLFYRAIIFGAGSCWTILLAMFLIELLVVKNLWCGRICPLGAFYSLIGKARLLRVKHNVESCTACNKCFEVCPEVQVLDIVKIKSGTINNSECTNCGRCIDVCAYKALKFGIVEIKKKDK